MGERVAGEQVTPDAIMQLGLGFWGAKTLLSAVELGLFTELATAGPQGAEDLRRRLGLHGRSARDFLDALVALRSQLCAMRPGGPCESAGTQEQGQGS